MENEFTASLLITAGLIFTVAIIIVIVTISVPVILYLIRIIVILMSKKKENEKIKELYGKENEKNRSNGKAGSHGKF